MFRSTGLGLGRVLLWLPLSLAAVLAPLDVSAQAEPTIKAIEIRPVGPRSVADDLVRANIRVKAGDPYSKLNIDDDVRNLYATGYFFNIRVSASVTRCGSTAGTLVPMRKNSTCLIARSRESSHSRLSSERSSGSPPEINTSRMVGVRSM